MDDRLRRRKGLDDIETSPSSNGHLGDGALGPSGVPALASLKSMLAVPMSVCRHWTVLLTSAQTNVVV